MIRVLGGITTRQQSDRTCLLLSCMAIEDRNKPALMLPSKHQSWFIPVLYRHATEEQTGPVTLLAGRDAPQDPDHLLALLGASTTFVGREQELRDLGALLTAAARGEE